LSFTKERNPQSQLLALEFKVGSYADFAFANSSASTHTNYLMTC
jgi:hypothetical protein